MSNRAKVLTAWSDKSLLNQAHLGYEMPTWPEATDRSPNQMYNTALGLDPCDA